MLSDQERRALRAHCAAVDGFEAARATERVRLADPEKARLKTLWDGIHSPQTPPVRKGRLYKEAERIAARVGFKLDEWDRANKPSLPTWETPARILRDVESDLSIIEPYRALVNPPERAAVKAREAYLRARNRIFDLETVVPSIPAQLPYIADPDADPNTGLDEIRRWCERVVRELAGAADRQRVISTESLAASGLRLLQAQERRALAAKQPAATTPETTPETPAERLQVHPETESDPPRIILDGKPYVVSHEGAAFVAVLLRNRGHWVSPAEFESDPILTGLRRDRIKKALPQPIRNLITGKSGGGYRLDLAQLA